MTRSFGFFAFVVSMGLGSGACGGSPPPKAAPPSEAKPAATATETPSATAGSANNEPSAKATPEARPFAKTSAEATAMVDDAIEKRLAAVQECVEAARTRRKDPHATVEFDVGIDQEGTLIGVKTPKGVKDDAALNDCVRNALRGAPFPRSNAGVVTMRKTFGGKLVYPK